MAKGRPEQGLYTVLQEDAFAWLAKAEPCSIHAVVTDPPYGLLEYTAEQLEKRKNGHGAFPRPSTVASGARCLASPS